MEQFTVNRTLLKFSWLFLFVWIISMSLFIIFLAMGSPLWIYMISGFIFIFFWIIIATTYPKSVVIGDDSIVFHLPGSDRIKTYKLHELEFRSKKGHYELIVSGTKQSKKFYISRKDIPAKLESQLLKIFS